MRGRKALAWALAAVVMVAAGALAHARRGGPAAPLPRTQTPWAALTRTEAPGVLPRVQADAGPLYTDEGEIPRYRPADIGGLPGAEGHGPDFALRKIIQGSDLVAVGRIAGKREGGRAKIELCTYTLIQVEQVLKGPGRDWVYVASSGRPLSAAQCRELSAAQCRELSAAQPGQLPGLARHPLTFAPIGSRVLLFLRRPSEELMPGRDIGALPIYLPWGGPEACYGLDEADAFYRLQPLGALPCPPGAARDRMYGQIVTLAALRELMAADPDPWIVEGVDLAQVYDRTNPEAPWYSDGQLEALGILGWRGYDGDRPDGRLETLLDWADAVAVGRLTDKRLTTQPQPATRAGIAVERVLKGELPGRIELEAIGAPVSAGQLRQLLAEGRVGDQWTPCPTRPWASGCCCCCSAAPRGDCWVRPLYLGGFGVGPDGSIRSLTLPDELLAQPISPARSALLHRVGYVDALAALLEGR